MPLLAPVIRAARQRRDQLQASLGVAQLAAWRSLLAPRWLPLPGLPGAQSRNGRRVDVAVDGTSHTVQLHNGAHFILAVAAANGPEYSRDERADMEILPARYDDAQAASARDLLMRSLEAFTATQAAAAIAERGEAERAILWVDGSLYADVSHMAGAPEKVQWGAAIERAGRLLETTAALFNRAEESGLWIIGIGKTQRAGFLFDALTATHSAGSGQAHSAGSGQALAAGSLRAAQGQAGQSPVSYTKDDVEVDGGRPADGELLATAGTGWSWPVLLDGRRFPVTSRLAEQTLRGCPAVISTYVRPHPADLPLRLDVPASAVGLDDRLLPDGTSGRPWPAWLPDPDMMKPVVLAALAAYGGMSVYNAPLFAVDRLVRLPRRELELRFLPVCERVAGLRPGTLGIDRGRRRFLSA